MFCYLVGHQTYNFRRKRLARVICSDEEESSSEDETVNKHENIVKSSRRNSTVRIRWTQSELHTLKSYFEPDIKKKKLPSFEKIRGLQEQCSVLKHRTPAQIKSRFSHLLSTMK